jgi:hypothetical protein
MWGWQVHDVAEDIITSTRCLLLSVAIWFSSANVKLLGDYSFYPCLTSHQITGRLQQCLSVPDCTPHYWVTTAVFIHASHHTKLLGDYSSVYPCLTAHQITGWLQQCLSVPHCTPNYWVTTAVFIHASLHTKSWIVKLCCQHKDGVSIFLRYVGTNPVNFTL